MFAETEERRKGAHGTEEAEGPSAQHSQRQGKRKKERKVKEYL